MLYCLYIIMNCLETLDSNLTCNPRTKGLLQTHIVTLKGEQISTINILRRVAAHSVQTPEKPPLGVLKHGNIPKLTSHELYTHMFTSALSIWKSPQHLKLHLFLCRIDRYMIRSAKPGFWTLSFDQQKLRFDNFNGTETYGNGWTINLLTQSRT